jgi:hypothetical protein
MKTQLLTVVVAAGVILAFTNGCSKSEEPAPITTTPESAPAAELKKAADTAKDQVKDAAASVSQAADKTATNLNAAATEAGAEVNTLFAQAKNFVTEKKYTEALNTLKQLSSLKLTPEQQKLLDDLKQQVQAALASSGVKDAASKLGNALGGNK